MDKPKKILTDSFQSFEDFVNRFTKSLMNESTNSVDFFSVDYVKQLKQEATFIKELCHELNQDNQFILKINELVDQNGSEKKVLTAENFFVADLIAAFERIQSSKPERARFTLAYYYDVLKNDRFANENEIHLLNEISSNPTFIAHIAKIISSNKLVGKNNPNDFFITSTLKNLNHPRFEKASLLLQRFILLVSNQNNAPENQAVLNKISNPMVEKDNQVKDIPADDTLEKVLEELNGMIGLEEVKLNVEELINLLKIQKKREEQGLKIIDNSLHTVFLGPPGTGKTSVARLLGRIFKHLGYLSRGQIVETDREGLVAGYVGQTAIKVDTIVNKSKGGVLFVDEAYSLTQSSINDFGSEAVDALLKRMEDNRDDLVVVVAGYTEPMKLFVESNPGLRSRFNRFFKFEHFTPEQLMTIFESFCSKSDFILTETAKEKLQDTFSLLYEKRDEGFGNARVVRNLFEKCVQMQANRIIKIAEISPEVLKTLDETDVPEPNKTLEQVFFTTE